MHPSTHTHHTKKHHTPTHHTPTHHTPSLIPIGGNSKRNKIFPVNSKPKENHHHASRPPSYDTLFPHHPSVISSHPENSQQSVFTMFHPHHTHPQHLFHPSHHPHPHHVHGFQLPVLKPSKDHEFSLRSKHTISDFKNLGKRHWCGAGIFILLGLGLFGAGLFLGIQQGDILMAVVCCTFGIIVGCGSICALGDTMGDMKVKKYRNDVRNINLQNQPSFSHGSHHRPTILV